MGPSSSERSLLLCSTQKRHCCVTLSTHGFLSALCFVGLHVTGCKEAALRAYLQSASWRASRSAASAVFPGPTLCTCSNRKPEPQCCVLDLAATTISTWVDGGSFNTKRIYLTTWLYDRRLARGTALPIVGCHDRYLPRSRVWLRLFHRGP